MKVQIFSITAKQCRWTDARGLTQISNFDTDATRRMPKKLLGKYEEPASWFKGRASYSVDGQPLKDQLLEWIELGYKVK